MLFEVFGGALLAVILALFKLQVEWVILFLWAVNLPAAWFLSQAARQQGRSAWITGFISLPPLFALLNYFYLSFTAKSR